LTNNNPLRRLLWAVLACALLAFEPAGAADLATSATASLTSDYLWRGYSKSDNRPSPQVNVDLSLMRNGQGGFAGTWLSSVNLSDLDAAAESGNELLLYAGWSQPLGNSLRVEAQYSRYWYNVDLYSKSANYDETYLFLHVQDWLSVEWSYTDSAYGTEDSAHNLQASFRYPLTAVLDVSANLGEYNTSNQQLDDYRYWSLGLTWKYQRYALDVRYVGMDETEEHTTERAQPHTASHEEAVLLATFSVKIF